MSNLECLVIHRLYGLDFQYFMHASYLFFFFEVFIMRSMLCGQFRRGIAYLCMPLPRGRLSHLLALSFRRSHVSNSLSVKPSRWKHSSL